MSLVNILKIKKKKIVFIFLVLLILNSFMINANSEENRKSFVLDLLIRENAVNSLSTPKIIYSNSPDYMVKNEGDDILILKLISGKDKVLGEFTIVNPRVLRSIHPHHHEVDEEESSIAEAIEVKETLVIPFYKDAKSIKIFNYPDFLIGEISVEDVIQNFCKDLDAKGGCDSDCGGFECKKTIFGESIFINWDSSSPVVVDKKISDVEEIKIGVVGDSGESILVISPDKENKKIRMTENGQSIDIDKDLKVIGSHLYIEDKIVNIMPANAADIAKEKIQISVKKSELDIINEKPLYTIKGYRKTKILGFIPANIGVSVDINAQTGEISNSKESWWSFLTK